MFTHIRLVLRATLLTGMFLSFVAMIAEGQSYRNTIAFVNQSGQDALVKVIGPVRGQVLVNNGTESAVHVPGGEFYILVRYCDTSSSCRYSRGDRFIVEETTTQYSEISITLQPVENGNYGSRPSSAQEFNEN